MMLDQPLRADIAIDLFVGRGGEDHVAVKWDVVALQGQERDQLHRGDVLHVQRAAPPHKTVGHVSAKGRMRPMLGFGWDHIQVIVEQQRRQRSVALQPRDDITTLRGRLQHDRIESLHAQHARQILDGGQLVTGGIGRIDAEQACR